MTQVHCRLTECIYNEDYECTREEISLYNDHLGYGGCDNGCTFEGEEEDE